MYDDLAVLVLVSLFVSVVTVYFQVAIFRKLDITAVDYYKPDRRKVPTYGGISLLVVLLSLFVYFDKFRTTTDFFAVFVISIFGVFGLLDDLMDIGKIVKIVVPVLFPLPLTLNLGVDTILGIYFGPILAALILSVYVMVVANLVNMHSGFNGLAVGLSAILLFFLLVKSAIFGRNLHFTVGCMLGAVLGLLCYNWYPAKIFDGNVGALVMGSSIGVAIVANGFLLSGFIMLIPHTVNFLMYVYWRVMRVLHPDDEKWKLVKFGKVREDGTLDVPNCLTLKWVLPYYFRITERKVVLAMYSLTLVFCIVSVPIPY